MAQFMYIDEVATKTGLTPRTLRFWEEKGLLPPPVRTEGGLRLYSEQDVARLIRIRELRDLLGLSLGFIGEMLHAEDEVDQLRAQAKQVKREERIPYLRRSVTVLEAQTRLISDRMARLQNLQQTYEERLTRLRRRLHELEAAAEEEEVPSDNAAVQ